MNTTEFLEKSGKSNTEDFGKHYLGCPSRNLYAHLLNFAPRRQLWILLGSLSFEAQI